MTGEQLRVRTVVLLRLVDAIDALTLEEAMAMAMELVLTAQDAPREPLGSVLEAVGALCAHRAEMAAEGVAQAEIDAVFTELIGDLKEPGE